MSGKHKYPGEVVEKIKHETEISEFISEHLELKKSNKFTGDYTALCPFHEEEIPSFIVFTRKQFFYCFGCGTGGVIFDFLMRIEGLSFLESIKYLERRLTLL